MVDAAHSPLVSMSPVLVLMPYSTRVQGFSFAGSTMTFEHVVHDSCTATASSLGQIHLQQIDGRLTLSLCSLAGLQLVPWRGAGSS